MKARVKDKFVSKFLGRIKTLFFNVTSCMIVAYDIAIIIML